LQTTGTVGHKQQLQLFLNCLTKIQAYGYVAHTAHGGQRDLITGYYLLKEFITHMTAATFTHLLFLHYQHFHQTSPTLQKQRTVDKINFQVRSYVVINSRKKSLNMPLICGSRKVPVTAIRNAKENNTKQTMQLYTGNFCILCSVMVW